MTSPAALSEAAIAAHAHNAVSVSIGAQRPDIVLLCEHGGRQIPTDWNHLGLSAPFFDTHFAHDIGSRSLTLEVAERLGATSVIANYSRLFLDYNRKSHDPTCIRPDMGGIPIPGNMRVIDGDRCLRERIARVPVESAVAGLFEGERPIGRAIVSIHSFSPVWEASYRSCEIGIMWKRDDRLPGPLIGALQKQTRYSVEDNQPYSFVDSDWFTLDRHGLSIGVPNAYIEVRNDLIESSAGIVEMADVLTLAIEEACSSLDRS
jgi:predicted N-formylglutamate amidohydrolase